MCFQYPLELLVTRQFRECFKLDIDLLGAQELMSRLDFFSIEGTVDIEDAMADMGGEIVSTAGVGGDHRFLDHAVGATPLFDADIQYIARCIQLEHIVGTVLEHQRMFGAPCGPGFTHCLQSA